jgi:fructose-specific PTS system IIA-like component
MPLKHHFICPLPNGVHARPASLLEEVSRNFTSEIILLNQRTGRTVSAKSVLAIISADIRHNDSCELTVSGVDEQEAMSRMTVFVDNTLPHCDDAPSLIPALNGKSHLPLVLQNTDVTVCHGTPVVPGVAQGRVVQAGGFKIPASLSMNGVTDSAAEWRVLDEALTNLIALYDRQLASAKKKIEIELLKAHRAIARDSEFHSQLHDAVVKNKRTAAGAIAGAEAHFSKMLFDSGSEMLRGRALDIQDVCFQLLRQVHGDAVGSMAIRLDADSIVVAESLTPGQFLAFDRNFLKGLVLAHAGTTSHTVILARSFGIPTLTGVSDLASARSGNQEAVIDADAGVLLTNLTETARRYYAMEQRRLTGRQTRVQQFAARPAATQDGHRIEIGANIASAGAATAAFDAGAEGVGLFRTEMLFLDRESAPDEAVQFEAYRSVLKAAKNFPVIIRTLDIGGDKPLDYLNLPAEENPFLGFRAVRIYPKFEPMFRTQVRALVRASAHGKLKLLLPMIATVDEARWVKKIISEEQAKCAAEKIPFDNAMPVGAMIELPAAAFAMDALCRELDFFSIGSNDLLQYLMAADRANASVAGLYNPLQPAFLRLLKQITDAARANKKWIGLCGEMGGQTKFLPLLAGFGLNEISASTPAIAGLKAELAGLKFADCQQLLAAALGCATAGEVMALLENFSSRRTAALIDPELVIVDSDAATKEEAIKQAVDRLYILGRTEDSRAVEEAIWRREQTYSTGFGHGFAIPHCKTNAMRFNSLVLLKLKSPVKWNSLDGRPVRVVILFAVRETNSATEHMKVFAKLARQVMNENFRARLENESDAGALCAVLREKLEIDSATSAVKI